LKLEALLDADDEDIPDDIIFSVIPPDPDALTDNEDAGDDDLLIRK